MYTAIRIHTDSRAYHNVIPVDPEFVVATHQGFTKELAAPLSLLL
jgi:hypothetical protein